MNHVPSFSIMIFLWLAALAPQAGAVQPSPVMTRGLGLDKNATCPRTFSTHAGSTLIIVCYCAPEAVSGSVWGTGLYTHDSSLCNAARHAGAIGPEGGMIQVKGAPGREAYAGMSQNGVVSQSYGNYDWSFFFPAIKISEQAAEVTSRCPGSFGDSRRIYCHCSPAEMAGSVWGTDIYTNDSSLCLAAVHAGVIGRNGGPVTALAAPGRKRYTGSERNGVSTKSYGGWEKSFVFAR